MCFIWGERERGEGGETLLEGVYCKPSLELISYQLNHEVGSMHH